MINLHIKGDINAAFKAADTHGVELTSLAMRWRSGIAECFASTIPECLPKVQAWYHEDEELIMGYGYPAGTLLFFNEQPLFVNPK